MPFGFGRGRGRAARSGPGRGFRGARAGGPSKCVCPNCGYEIAHVRGKPCSAEVCPKCGTRMIGKWE